jgi:hypothetical protein
MTLAMFTMSPTLNLNLMSQAARSGLERAATH